MDTIIQTWVYRRVIVTRRCRRNSYVITVPIDISIKVRRAVPSGENRPRTRSRICAHVSSHYISLGKIGLFFEICNRRTGGNYAPIRVYCSVVYTFGNVEWNGRGETRSAVWTEGTGNVVSFGWPKGLTGDGSRAMLRLAGVPVTVYRRGNDADNVRRITVSAGRDSPCGGFGLRRYNGPGIARRWTGAGKRHAVGGIDRRPSGRSPPPWLSPETGCHHVRHAPRSYQGRMRRCRRNGRVGRGRDRTTTKFVLVVVVVVVTVGRPSRGAEFRAIFRVRRTRAACGDGRPRVTGDVCPTPNGTLTGTVRRNFHITSPLCTRSPSRRAHSPSQRVHERSRFDDRIDCTADDNRVRPHCSFARYTRWCTYRWTWFCERTGVSNTIETNLFLTRATSTIFCLV